jgi:hypothetical protein
MSDAAETVKVCPECSDHRIRERVNKEPTYRCSMCTERFETPTEREKHIRGVTHPDVMYGAGAYDELKAALRRTLDAGSRYARARVIERYTDRLSSEQIGQLLTDWGADDGLVSIYNKNSRRTLYLIEIDGGIDDG